MLTMTSKFTLFLCIFYTWYNALHAYNILRPLDISLPSIHVTSTQPAYTELWNTKTKKMTDRKKTEPENKVATLSSKFLQLTSLQNCFNPQDLQDYALPLANIPFRHNKTQNVSGAILSNLAQNLVQEICNGKKEFNDFTVLKDSDFNYKIKAGLLVVKYKEYPFVLKLSIEHPDTFVQPFNKGFVPSAIFNLSGTNRHMSGLTRIANLHAIQKKLADDIRFDFVRKWFWLPQKDMQPWLLITWHDPLDSYTHTFTIPSIYGVIADFIEPDTQFIKKNSAYLKQLSIETANKLGFKTDPHFGNFVPELNQNHQGFPKIVIIDTEDFPLTVGLDSKKPMQAKNYIDYYYQLCKNYLKKRLGRSKKRRIEEQRQKN